ncbi:polysaccharide deacetylase family protein [Pusillimonas noertemannii]|uniref:Polysaccharide deacetylase n=1 Tax=Pusillimonas noertemannii TaxID=305977 RepID=A0A2U1CKM0_9BURK|nr:polysaccharide deacetylase family protein [Pusillimonas noertemannii]NYT69075.1 polysaccharide deacetylase family protein [Pusillimonas noertemannii]PVY61542.1 polysaccharide deacetylase [Pusillimonas noertemannii]TFL09491.1 polysaccharide deacetylase [Pusillimonas noertemannii]
MAVAPHTPPERAPYSAIVDRPPLRLPEGKRIAVWTIVNVEHWHHSRAMPRTVLPPPMHQPFLPDIPNWAWHEYGMRVGFWRFVDVLERHGVTPTLAINGSVCRQYPRIAQEAFKRNWEFMGHGYEQGPMHKVEDQRAAIRETIDSIREVTGRAPRGWEGPGLTESDSTLDWLAEAGIEYVADWVLDDQPVYLNSRHGPIVSVPYTVEINDVVISAIQQHGSDEIYRRGVAQFDQLYEESGDSARVMAISVHPYLTGVPHRINALHRLYEHIRQRSDVAFMTGEQIHDWYRGQRCPEL